jgi:hypothetical protein
MIWAGCGALWGDIHGARLAQRREALGHVGREAEEGDLLDQHTRVAVVVIGAVGAQQAGERMTGRGGQAVPHRIVWFATVVESVLGDEASQQIDLLGASVRPRCPSGVNKTCHLSKPVTSKES